MTTTKTERILTLHPGGKRGVRIERATYDAMRRALLRVVPRRRDGVAFAELAQRVAPHLEGSSFPPHASVPWYVVAVKQDLEARGAIEQVPGSKPQRLRRVAGGGR